jgi:hypothetical protein
MKTKNHLKYITLIIIFLFAAMNISYAQDKESQKVRIQQTGKVNVKELSKQEKGHPETSKRTFEIGPEENTISKPLPIPTNAPVKKSDIKPGYSKKPSGTISMPLTPGLNGSGFGTLRPPDMGGAVSSSYLVETINTQIGFFDKTGALMSAVGLATFFSSLGTAPDVFDPHVLYDSYSQRWVITAAANRYSATSGIVIAISDTDDPTSTWTKYLIDADASDDSWLDFPQIGINKNWIVVSGNLFGISYQIAAATNAANCQITTSSAHAYQTGDHISFYNVSGMTQLNGNTYTITVTGATTFLLNTNSTAFGVYTTSPTTGICANVSNPNGTDVFVMDKAAMYAGGAPAATLFNPAAGFSLYPAYVCDNTTNDLKLVANWNGNSGGNGYLGVYTISGAAAAPVISAIQYLSVTSTWGCCVNAPQLGSAVLIRNNDSRMEQVVLRNGSLWCAHTVFLPAASPTHSAVQWWQIDPATLTVQQFGRIEDATATNFYAFPSIDVNAYGDVLVGFSRFSSSQFGGANYAYHLHTDAAGTMNADVQFKGGLAKYDLQRWGDYSSTITDPDLFTIWTLQQYAESPIGGVDQWGTEWNRVTMPVPDLYSQDRSEDAGAEPDPSTLPMWQSQDIWLRQTQDAAHASAHMHQDAEYRSNPAKPNYVYVEVRNRGGASSSGTEQLSLYWAKAGSALSWPSSWDGTSYFDSPANTMSMGAPIGAPQTMPVIAAGASVILEFPWMPPFPDAYSLPYLIGDKNHFCLLARITTSATAPYGMTFPETSDLYQNVQNNNNIVWKNIEVYNLDPSDAPEYTVVGNMTTDIMRSKFKFEVLDQNGVSGLLNKGKIKVEALGKLKEILKRNPPSGKGIESTGEGIFEVRMDGAVLDNITLQPKDMGAFIMNFIAGSADVTGKGFAVNFTQIENKNGTDHIIGGQTFVFGQVKGFGTSPSAAHAPILMWHWWYWILIILIVLLLFLWMMRKK